MGKCRLNNDKKQKLIDLGAERLAHALLEIAVLNDAADDLVERLIATPKENIQRFKKKLTVLKRSKRFIDWRGSSGFARDLTMLLQDLKSGDSDPLTGVEMIARLQGLADKDKDEYGRRRHLMLIESLARQIKDAKLFEKTRIASWGKLSTAAFIDIARVYLEGGDVEAAHLWLNKIPEDETFQAYERDQLLLDIFRQQGDSEKLTDLLHRKFRSHRSMDTLQALLDVIGHEKQDKIIVDEIALILESSALRESDANFLIATGKIDEAVNWELMKYLRWSRDRSQNWEGTE